MLCGLPFSETRFHWPWSMGTTHFVGFMKTRHARLSSAYDRPPSAVGGIAGPERHSPRAVVKRCRGVLRLTIQSAHLKKEAKRLGRSPNALIIAEMCGKECARTEVRPRTWTPNWMEDTHDLLIYDFEEHMKLRFYTHHDVRPDRLLATAELCLDTLGLDQKQYGRIIDLHHPWTNSVVGDVLLNLEYFPTLEPSGKICTESGVLGVTIHQGKALAPMDEEEMLGHPPVAVFSLGWASPAIHTAATAYRLGDPENPAWEANFETFCCAQGPIVTVKIMESKRSNGCLGHMSVPLSDILERNIVGPTWWPLTGSKNGKLLMSLEWRPISA
ncbi:hypothetical protein BDN72DRAFT_953307 [Pluteus cervinus]|uniref:Uncharacterized protein n=1 Tax=Pluteus cervinus TaxID=181527 RepID=A0ACD3BF05_9AGAR|nr:hypothetical protein BDN72DRAFT_953307 [Pluteus cervinus]